MSRFDPELVPVTRLRPIRVLLVSRDRRFLRMASVLLNRRGCEIGQLERPSDLLDQVDLQRPNVVVLDGSDSVSAAAKEVVALQALPTPVSTLVVCERVEGYQLCNFEMLPKWGAIDELASEVERLYAGSGRRTDNVATRALL